MIQIAIAIILGLFLTEETGSKFKEKLNPETRLALTPELEAAFSPEAKDALTPEVAEKITPAILSALSPQVAAALRPEVVSALTPELVMALTPENVRALRPELVAAFTPNHIKALSPAAVAMVTPETVESFAPEVLLNIPPEIFTKLTPDNAYMLTSFFPSSETINAFRSLTYNYSGGRYQNEQFRYRLHVPVKLEQGIRYPLLMWLHGAGECGSDNMLQLAWLSHLIFRDRQHPENYPFFLLAVQCPSDTPQWFQSKISTIDSLPSMEPNLKGDEPLTIAMEILEQTLQSYPIDEDRISLAGISSGGSGCWEMAMRYPTRFASIAPLSSSGGDLSRIHRITNVPIRAFHSVNDKTISIDVVRKTVDALEEAGGRVLLTGTNAAANIWTHDSWTSAFWDHDLLFWLLSERRDNSSLKLPIESSTHLSLSIWPWWQIALESTLLVVLLLACRQEWKRRRKTTANISTNE